MISPQIRFRDWLLQNVFKSRLGVVKAWVFSLFVLVSIVTSPATADDSITNGVNAQPILVVLGDSISAGHGVDASLGWVKQFSAKLEQSKSNIKVVNESISGEVTAGGLSRLPGILARHKPTWLIIELGGNDGLRGLSPKVMQRNLDAKVKAAQATGAQVFLFGMKLPPNYGKHYNQLFEQAFVKVADANQIPLLPFFLDGVGGVDEYMQSDRIHPNNDAQVILMNNAWTFLSAYLPLDSK
ncbi:MAG: arylesterase [Pseudomonadales bacterium]|nr:arylesterase [Pseudomonadales bacterium]